MRRTLLLTVLGAACRTTPGSMPEPAESWEPLAALVDSAVQAGAAPGAVVAVSRNGRRFFHGSGRLGQDDPSRPGPNTVYDLASLTKVLILTTSVMLAVDEGLLSLDDPVQRLVPEFQGAGKEQVTVRQLLTHTSGLPAHRRLWEEATTRDAALALVFQTPLDTTPGTRTVYSDLGIIVLTQAIERVFGLPIDVLARRRILDPLGLSSTRYRPPPSWRDRIAPTELDPWRGRMLRGEVHDENAALLGGVSGHAGLFGSASDLVRFGEWLLGDGAASPPLPRSLPGFIRRAEIVPGSSRALGWDTPSPGSSAGTRLSARSIGHTGFTGTSIWIDFDRRLVVVLLSNRVHPTRDNPALGRLRPLVADCSAGLADGFGCPN